jgi:hypothetical protein
MLAAFGLAVLVGCSNPYQTFFQPNPNLRAQVVGNPNYEQVTAEPKIYSYSASPDDDYVRLIEDGYVFLGEAIFNSGAEAASRGRLLDQARDVGATLVMVTSRYTNTVSGSIPITTYHPGQTVTSNTTGNANVYSSDGSSAYGTYSGTTTTQLPGTTSTNFVPYNVARYDFGAGFYTKKLKGFVFGAYCVNPSPELRTQLGKNGGAVLMAVVRGTPAFNADFMVGDVLLALNGNRVVDAPSFFDDVDSLAGQTVRITRWRNGDVADVDVRLGAR